MCSTDVEAVARILPPSRLGPSLHDIGPVTLRGEVVRIPSRIYFAEPSVGTVQHLTDRQKTILTCLLTRHDNGFVREKMVRQLLLQDADFWTAPFVVQLLGEYVLEIILAVQEGIQPKHREIYAEFLHENPKFHALTRARVASYRACYHRHPFPTLAQYPGSILLSTLEP